MQKVEGFSAVAYSDRDSHTIGFGHNISELPIPDDMMKELRKNGKAFGSTPLIMGLTMARHLLKRDIGFFYTTAERVVPHFRELSTNRQEAMTEMLFNMGETRFRGFVEMLKALDNKNYKKASKEMLDSKWHREKQVGDRSRFLAEKMRKG